MHTKEINSRLDFVSIQVRDIQKSEKFYRKILGFKLSNYQNSDATVFQNEAGAVFAVRKPFAPLSENQPLGFGVSLWFGWVDNIESLETYLESKGVIILKSLYNTPFGKSITIADPDGYAITLHQVDSHEN
ncbi:MAG: VOC family protein [Cyclobacteriaceae bacterium]